MSIKPIRLLIPAIFLVVLGVGNVLVGHFKYQQYNEMLNELNSENNFEKTENLSPLQRLKYTSNSSTKVISLKQKAEARRELYQLVSYSGKIFLTISTLFFVASILTRRFTPSP